MTAPISTNACICVAFRFLVTQDQTEAGTPWVPLSRGVMWPLPRRNPYPARYWLAFASSVLLYPPPHRLAFGDPLGVAFPEGGRRAYHVSCQYPRGVGPASPPGVRHLRQVS
jgi:hypothetical protein